MATPKKKPNNPKQPEKSPAIPKAPKLKSPGMTGPSLEKVSTIQPIKSDIQKLDQLAEKIKTERALDDKQEQINANDQQQFLKDPIIPAAETFNPDPALVQITAGMTFWVMKKAVNFFEKDLTPLTDHQKAGLERIVDKMARKYIPASMAKFQESGEVFFVLGGIVMSNMKDLGAPQPPTASPAADSQKDDQPGTLPPIPSSEAVQVG